MWYTLYVLKWRNLGRDEIRSVVIFFSVTLLNIFMWLMWAKGKIEKVYFRDKVRSVLCRLLEWKPRTDWFNRPNNADTLLSAWNMLKVVILGFRSWWFSVFQWLGGLDFVFIWQSAVIWEIRMVVLISGGWTKCYRRTEFELTMTCWVFWEAPLEKGGEKDDVFLLDWWVWLKL